MLKKFVFSTGIFLLLTACQTHFPLVSESDQTVNTNYCKENKPLTQINYLFYANTMIDSLTQTEAIQEKTNAGRIRLYVNPINNESGKSIDMGSIDEEILNRINRSAMFVLVKNSNAADYSLSGMINTITKRTNQCLLEQEQFIIELRQPHTNTLFWSETKLLH